MEIHHENPFRNERDVNIREAGRIWQTAYAQVGLELVMGTLIDPLVQRQVYQRTQSPYPWAPRRTGGRIPSLGDPFGGSAA